ncbi:flagellar export chaperone FliS [Nocardioides sp. YIM 152315]|uniref:flagellar export chaperone FliS n=1 Tax=Nocardioides sp. YIM 152315 TaxID=3031760 RepID=UPI0023DAD1B3|nr:flagellar export chaperone FliS [Nocardioides sp. YIM 152315]MDF1605957.1 flagellar export chaperone FliS [Nocardioides sp. YIM 152315]
MTNLNPRETYLAASVSTASPSQLLVMLYERLVLDVERAVDALRRGEPSQAHQPLLHAQEIVLELNASLDVDAWEGAKGLASLYDYLHSELVKANMAKDLKVAEFCLHTVTVLRDTWREAAGSLLAETA